MKRKVDLQNVNMKKLFRRNQIIVTTLAVLGDIVFNNDI